MVLNCILNTQKDTLMVQLSYSKRIQEIVEFEPITDAKIQLFEDGEKIGDLLWTDSSTYILPFSVLNGKKYRIEAKNVDNNIWAETTVPKIIDASIDKPTFGYGSYRVSLNKNPENNNFYWVSATGYEGSADNQELNIARELYSNFEYADDFNRRIYENGLYKFEYEYYIRFTENELSTDQTEVIFYPQYISSPIEVFLLSVDYHLDKYMKSSLLIHDMDLYAQDMPIIYSPFPMYSNINGGTGIFGSYTGFSKVFTKN
ncbi:hypothetical protein MASR2M47_19760 [Draconibacterium sp.]|jgi:hypothetical protein